MTGGNSMGFATTGPVCLRTNEPLNTVGCSNFAGRSLSVNGMPVTCTDNTPAKAPRKIQPAMVNISRPA